jgi:hypothetical protein
MNAINHFRPQHANRRPQNATPNRRNAHRPAPRVAVAPSGRLPSRRLRAELISDGVVASYIHDISQRHRR